MKAGSFIQRMPFSERSLLPRSLAIGVTMLLIAALPAGAKPKTTPAQTVVIESSGSTNTLGYTISVAPGGNAQIADAMPQFTNGSIPSVGSMKFKSALLPKAQAKKLFQDLAAAMPLTSLPVRHGMRSASFRTQTYITYKGQKSPDLTFASDPRTVALKADIDAITKALQVGNAPRHPIVIQESTKQSSQQHFLERF